MQTYTASDLSVGVGRHGGRLWNCVRIENRGEGKIERGVPCM